MKKQVITSLSLIILTVPFACKKTTVKTTYNTDIKTIMTDKCTNCHNGVTSSDLTTYATVKTGVSDILARMNQAEGTPGFMPQGGAKTQANIDKITKWQSDGLLEK